MTKDQILKKIGEIEDPDLGISIVELGLIYNLQIKDKTADILMTLTTPACPLASTFEQQVKERLKDLGIEKINVSFTFDPPWTVERISEETKLKLGLLT